MSGGPAKTLGGGGGHVNFYEASTGRGVTINFDFPAGGVMFKLFQ